MTTVVVVASCSGAGDSISATTSFVQTTTSTTLPGPLPPSEVFARVSPGLAFIDTAIGTGSGVLIEEARLLTNAHVVWPFREVRVVFPDGTELPAAPVVAWDVMADLAILDVSAAGRLPDPTPFADGESAAIGTELYLIGYPAEVEDFPQPTLSSGVLSRFRTWDAIEMTYLQTDAAVDGGQSGGALVSEKGEIIGISGLSFGTGFALAASAPDVAERVQALLAGEPPNALDDRTLRAEGEEVTTDEAELANFLDEATWVFTPRAGDEVSFEADSAGDVSLAVVSSDGFVEVFADDSVSEPETGSFEAVMSAPHVIAVGVVTQTPTTVTVSGVVPFRLFVDPDHGRVVSPGDTIAANIDYPTDVDYFLLELAPGQTVTISVDSMNFDADLLLDKEGNTGEILASDTDSGGGIMGWDPRITFTAEETGTYLIGVVDQSGVGPGGYFLTIRES
jgi:S1-C subfamily serine protease